MTREEICTFEVAKLAKEKGFPQDVDRWVADLHSATNSNYYNHKGELNGDCIEIIKCKIQKEEIPKEFELVAAPTQSLLQRWLREEKGIIVDVVLDWQYNIEAEEIRYQYRIGSVDRMTIEGGIKTKGLVFDKRFTAYELALEDALAYSLKNLV